MRALLVVHPDKQIGAPLERVVTANAVFDAIRAAFSYWQEQQEKISKSA